MTHPKGCSGPQIALRWIVALPVAGQCIFKDHIATARDAIRKGTDFAFDPLILAHVAGGALTLVFVLWRLTLRLKRGLPLPPENEPAPLKRPGHVAHWAFCGVLAIMSVSGALDRFAAVTLAAQV